MSNRPKSKTTKLFDYVDSQNFRREMFAHGAYDFRKGWDANYGIHGLVFYFTLSRGNCAVDFEFSTQLQTKKVTREFNSHVSEPYGLITKHSPMPQYEDHEPNHLSCEYTSGPCFSTHSGLDGTELTWKFIEDPETMWKELKQRLIKLEQHEQNELALRRNFS